MGLYQPAVGGVQPAQPLLGGVEHAPPAGGGQRAHLLMLQDACGEERAPAHLAWHQPRRASHRTGLAACCCTPPPRANARSFSD